MADETTEKLSSSKDGVKTSSVITAAQKHFRTLCYTLTNVASRTVFIIALSVLLIWLSIFIYISFYYNYIPTVSHVRPVHLQFSPECRKSGYQRKSLYPYADVRFSKSGYNQLLMTGQRYRMYVDMSVPDSEVNQKIGMFAITLNIKDQKENILLSSTRSTMLHYKSPLLRFMHIVFYSPFYLLGSVEEEQHVVVSMFEEYEENLHLPSFSASVMIQSCDIQIYSINLHITAEFSGLRYYMISWPITSASIGVATGLFFLCFVALLSWYRFIWKMKLLSESPSSESNLRSETKNEQEVTTGVQREADSTEMPASPSSSIEDSRSSDTDDNGVLLEIPSESSQDVTNESSFQQLETTEEDKNFGQGTGELSTRKRHVKLT